MARPVYCDEGDGNQAMVLVTNLDTGEAAAICAEHWPAWIRALADALPPGPGEVPAEEATAAAVAAGEEEAGQDPPRPKRRRAGRQNGSQALTSPASPFPDPTPVDS